MFKFTLLGLGVGGLYSIAALGIVTIHRGSKVLNVAHGAIATWGAFIFVRIRDDWGQPALLAGVAVLAAAAVFGSITYLVVFRPLREATPIRRLVASMGVLVTLQGLAVKAFGTDTRLVSSSLPTSSVEVLGVSVTADRLLIFGIAVALAVALAVWSAWSRLALATQAMSEHGPAASALGYSPDVLGALNWALGSALAALAGVLLVPLLGLGPNSIGVIVVPALAAALLGRFESYWLALAGGLTLGIAESLTSRYVTITGASAAVPFLLIMTVLLAQRPAGSNRTPPSLAIAASPAHLRPAWAATAVAALGATLLLAGPRLVDAVVVSMVFAILALSLVLLIGFANQISFAPMAIAGLGAFAAAKLGVAHGLPFELAPVVGIVVGAVAGLVVGLPGLRVRSVNLAVVTIGISLALERIVFGNADYTGGIDGLQPPRPTFFGVDVDAITQPRRYGFVVLAWLVAAFVAVVAVRRSALGRRLLAMRTNERASAALGIDVVRAKLTAFVISSALAGGAGVLLAYRQPTVELSIFSFYESINLATVTVIAGAAAVSGGLLAGGMAVGGLFYELTQRFQFVRDNYAWLFGIALVVNVHRRPQGIVGQRRPRSSLVELGLGDAAPRAPRPLVADGVTVDFGGVRAVDAVSLTVTPGEIVGLVGPNGAGKTTLLDALSGMVRISGGTISLGPDRIESLGAARRARLGLCRTFQGVELFDDLSLSENLLIAGENAGDGRRLPPAVSDALQTFGLASTLGDFPSSLPHGRRRLAGVARALAANPAVLLLDEPAAGLSSSEALELGAELRRIVERTGIGILLVEHDMGMVLSHCDQVHVLVGGAVLTSGSPAAVTGNLEVQRAFLGHSGAGAS